MSDTRFGIDETALYYPGMQPSAGWIRRSLLTSDRLSSIVHPDLAADLPTDLAQLAEVGLWSAADVSRLASQSRQYLDEINAALEDFASRPEYSFRGGNFPALSELTRLYIGKLDRQVEVLLLEKSLAKLGRYGGTVSVHHDVAAIVLAITARYVAGLNRDPHLRVVPSTDLPQAVIWAFEPLDRRVDRHRAMELLLDGLVPQPSSDTTIATILKFRQQHMDELLHFRVAVGDLIEDVQRSDYPIEAIRNAREKIEAALADVHGAARAYKLGISLGSLAVIGLGVTSVVLPDTAPIWQAFGGVGATAAAGVAGMWIRDNQIKENGYSYLAASRRRFAQ